MTVEEKQDMCCFVLSANHEPGAAVALVEHYRGVAMALSGRGVMPGYGRKPAAGSPDNLPDNQAVIDACPDASRD